MNDHAADTGIASHPQGGRGAAEIDWDEIKAGQDALRQLAAQIPRPETFSHETALVFVAGGRLSERGA